MPGDNNANVLFGAEFDASGLTAGVNNTISKLNELKNKEVELKNAIKETNLDLKTNADTYKQIQRELQRLNPDNVRYRENLDRLNKAIKESASDEASLKAALDSKQKSLIATQIELKNLTSATKTHTVQNDALTNSLNKLTSVNTLASRGVNRFSRELISIAFGAVGGFAGIIVAEAIPAIAGLIKELGLGGFALSSFQKDLAITQDIRTKFSSNFGGDLAKMELIKAKLNDLSIPEAQRLALLKEYNKTADESNKIDAKQLDNLSLINNKMLAQIELLRERATARAAESVIADKAEKLFLAQLTARGKAETDRNSDISRGERAIIKDGTANLKAGETFQIYNAKTKKVETRVLTEEDVKKLNSEGAKARKAYSAYQDTRRIETKIAADKDVQAAQDDLDRALKIGAQLVTAEGLTTPAGQKDPKGKVIENVFKEKLADLKARLSKASDSVFQSDDLIKKQFEAALNKEYVEIEKLLREKKLTVPQAQILKGLAFQINDIDQAKSLEEFHIKQREALEKINDEINSDQIEVTTKNILNIRNDLDRQAAVINESFDRTIEGIRKKQREAFEQIQKDVKTGLISKDEGATKSIILSNLFGGMINAAEVAKTNAQLDLAFQSFQKTIEEAKKPFAEAETTANEDTTKRINELTRNYLDHTISYDKYQKRLTKILRDEVQERRNIQIREAEDELDAINKKLDSTTDPKQRDALKKSQEGLRNQIASLNRASDEAEGADAEAKVKERVENFTKYAQAVEQVTASILNFYEESLKVEAEQINRSLALQQTRVDRARTIAERGNAQYLLIEEKRQDTLLLKQQENARKQLAVNQALTLSQATVAAVTAIGQAVATGSPFAAIAAVASVIGAIAAAFSFVNSLQPVTASFYEGTKEVQGTGAARGKDTVKANLNIGERVVPTDTNYQYWDALNAIHDHEIPATVINDFVNQYPNFSVPSLDFDRLSSANKLGSDSREVANKLDSVNLHLQEVHNAIGKLGINVKMDEEGFSASISKAAQTKFLKSKS